MALSHKVRPSSSNPEAGITGVDPARVAAPNCHGEVESGLGHGELDEVSSLKDVIQSECVARRGSRVPSMAWRAESSSALHQRSVFSEHEPRSRLYKEELFQSLLSEAPDVPVTQKWSPIHLDLGHTAHSESQVQDSDSFHPDPPCSLSGLFNRQTSRFSIPR